MLDKPVEHKIEQGRNQDAIGRAKQDAVSELGGCGHGGCRMGVGGLRGFRLRIMNYIILRRL